MVLMVGIQSHGQGLETALSQIACEELGIDPARISVRHGDTESTAFGFGTFASRSMVMSGGAVARASRILRDKLCRIGAHLLQCDLAETRCEGGAVHGPKGSVTDRRDRRRSRICGCTNCRPASSRCSTRPRPMSRASARGSIRTRRMARWSLWTRDRRDRTARFRRRRGLRHDGQPDAGRGSDPRRRGARYRHGAATKRSPTTRMANRSPRRFSITTCRARMSCRRSGSGTCTRRRRRPNTA